ncbi:MAG: glutamate--tRNA ligase family protein, partial [Verrucomicrobiales bacterium]
MITRFAPSPTGLLHLGHAFSALTAWELASAADGTFLLRFEDIDYQRVRDDFYAFIEDDLRWLGIDWPEKPLRQRERLDHYERALEQLRGRGVLYPCFCTRREINEELAAMHGAPHGPEGAHYPGTCRNLSPLERTRLAREREPAWRLDAEKAARLVGPLDFIDE